MNRLLKILLALFVVLALDLFLLVKIAMNWHAPAVAGLIFLTGMLGIFLVKMKFLMSSRVVRKIEKATDLNKVPIKEGMQAVFVLIGGAGLIFPGFITDVLGLLLIFDVSRNLMFKIFYPNFEKSQLFMEIEMKLSSELKKRGFLK